MAVVDQGLPRWVEINDFTPGIHTVAGSNHPLGASTTDTYRCVAAENGALIPGPKVTYAIDHAPFEDDPATVTTEDNKYWIGGLYANPAAVYGGLGNPYPGVDQNNTELFIGMEYYTSTSNIRKVLRYRRNYEDPGDRWQTILTATTGASVNDYTRPNRFYAAFTRSNPGATTVAGQPIAAFCYNGGDTAVVFPDPTDPASMSTSAWAQPGGDALVSIVAAHNGRLIGTPLTVYADGSGQVTVSNEALYWTGFQDHTSLDSELSGNYYSTAMGLEHPSGYADIQSLSASELFLLKINGGGIIMRGSINNPDVVRLPFVQSPGINMCTGAATPVGYCYVVKGGGLWVWAGGDTSEFVSPQMANGFWQPTTDFYEGTAATGSYYWHYADCHPWQEWVVLPSSYVWDWRRKAFYRIAERDLFFYATSPDQRFLYGARARFDHENRFVMWEFDRTRGASSYRWTSTFIPGTVENKVRLDTLEIVAEGQGTVTVTPITTQPDGTTTKEHRQLTAEVNSNEPVAAGLFSVGDVQGTHLQFRVDAVNAAGVKREDGPAPTVHSIRFSIVEELPAQPRR